MNLKEALQELKRGNIQDRNYGICYSLYTLGIKQCDSIKFDVLAKRWAKYSGNYTYPIPGGCEGFHQAQRNSCLWEGEQLELRMELIQFCLDELEKEQQNSSIPLQDMQF